MEKHLLKIAKISDDMDLEIVDVEFLGKDELGIRLMHKDLSSVDLETCVEASRAFSKAIDYEVSLDVSSAGAERLVDPEDYHRLQEKFVLVKFKNPTQGADYVEGTVLEVDDSGFLIEYQLMHRKKTIKIDMDNVAFCRLAVKV